jgi:hypothetical protein
MRRSRFPGPARIEHVAHAMLAMVDDPATVGRAVGVAV